MEYHDTEQELLACSEAGMLRLGWSLAMVAAAGFCWTVMFPAAGNGEQDAPRDGDEPSNSADGFCWTVQTHHE